MLVPESAYLFTVPKDLAGERLSSVIRNVVNNDASAAVTQVLFQNPRDRVCVISTLNVLVTPWPTQNFTGINLAMRVTGETQQLYIKNLVGAGAAGAQGTLQHTGEFWLPPGWEVISYTSFNSGALNNEVRSLLIGLSIPRGDVQLA